MAKPINYNAPDLRDPGIGDKSITPSSDITSADQNGFILDRNWAKVAFLINDQDLKHPIDINNRYWSSADIKFTDTRLGGNIGINPRPQFTRYSDIRRSGVLNRTPVNIHNGHGNHGMGRYYSEAIDDNAQRIYLRFGVMQFNSISAFISQAFNTEMSYLVKTGRISDAYRAGYASGNVVVTVGTILAITAYPVLSLTLLAGSALVNTYFSRPRSRFCSLKPTPFIYWAAVDTLLNTLLINSGVIPRTLSSLSTSNSNQQIGNPYQIDQTTLSDLHTMLPDIFTSENGIDTFAAANKAQRLANAAFLQCYNDLDTGSFTGYVQKTYQKNFIPETQSNSFADFLNKTVMTTDYFQSKSNQNGLEVDPIFDSTTGQATTSVDKGSFSQFFDAENRQGSQFATFIVDNTGTVNESFSNTAIESDLSNKINTTASQVREAQFNFAEGNLSDSGIANLAQQALGTVKDYMGGLADSIGISSISILAGNGFIDIPKHWQSSNAHLTSTTYNIKLISPYGNIISRIQNIYFPLCMLLAAALPRSVGNQSYTSPFYLQLFDRGRCQIRLGMIESLNISRGTSNIPFTNKGIPLAIDVSFSVVDMSTIMHMPISTGKLFAGRDVDTNKDKTLDEDNILMDYLAVLAGQDIYSQIYSIPKGKLNIAKKFHSLERMTSPAYLAAAFHEETTNGLLSSSIFGNVTSLFETLSKGNSVIPRY